MPDTPPVTGERIVLVTDEHWIKYVFPSLIALAMTGFSGLLFLLAGYTAHHQNGMSVAAFLAGLALLLLTHHWYFLVLLGESLDKIVITNRRLIRLQYRALLFEDILEISFEKMKTVASRKRGVLQNVLNYGTLLFETKLATVPLIPHPNRVADDIQRTLLLP